MCLTGYISPDTSHRVLFMFAGALRGGEQAVGRRADGAHPAAALRATARAGDAPPPLLLCARREATPGRPRPQDQGQSPPPPPPPPLLFPHMSLAPARLFPHIHTRIFQYNHRMYLFSETQVLSHQPFVSPYVTRPHSAYVEYMFDRRWPSSTCTRIMKSSARRRSRSRGTGR